jgi:murein DD-endopeptidase MepM/ murein hydrolase activator NlpD
MKFRIVFGILILSLGILGTVGLHVDAAFVPLELQKKIEETRRERDALLLEQQRLQAELNAVSRQGQTLASAVKSLDTTRKKLANDIYITQSKISSANLNIEALEGSMGNKGQQINIHKKALALTIKALADHGSRSLIIDFLSAEKMSDIWDDQGRLLDINGSLQTEIALLREVREKLDTEIVLSERTKRELLGLQNELDAQRRVVEENKAAQERLLTQTKNTEAEYQKMLALNLARQRQFENELFLFESELKMILDPSLIPPPRPGVLAWPIDNVFITQRFGKTSASGRLYASGTHNGVDFRAAMGTPIKAALSGVVEGVGNTDEQRGCYSYGRWILIKHPNGLSTIYAHLSGSLVKAGQTVTTGQVIGYSGGTPGVFGSGYSTGPHLHLGLFASQGVAIRQFTTSINCKQVFVPIADAQAYLDPLVYLPLTN